MAEAEKLDELVGEIKALIKKMDAPKTDIRGWLTIIVSFLASVVISGMTLYFSNKESVRGFEERQRSFAYNQMRDSFQVEIQKANLRVDELQALKDLIPLLASNDAATRAIAIQLLKASSEKGQPNSPALVDTGSKNNDPRIADGLTTKTSIIDKFYSILAIAGSSTESIDRRIQALKETESFLISNKISASDKAKGLTIVSELAASPSTPEPIRKSAEALLANIKLVSAAELPKVLNSEKVTRPINSIILHHVGAPFTAANFKGASTLINIGKFQTSQLNWNRLSWHYAIAPDGSIWLGMPLNDMAIHAKEQSKSSVSILLIIDGDKELPTEAQKTTVSALIKLLTSKLQLKAENIHPHRFYDQRKNCPGNLLDDEYLSQLTK